MLRTIFWKDIRHNLLTFRFAATIVVLFATINISVAFNAGDYIRRAESYRALEFQAAEEAKEHYVPSLIQPLFHWPPTKLSIFVQGEEKRLGNSTRITRWQVPVEAIDSLSDNELMATMREFDLLAIYTTVLSLLALLLSYDSICGERERGILKSIVSNSVRRSTLFLGKFFALITLLAISLAVSMITALIVLTFAFEITFGGGEFTAIFVFFLLGVLISAVSVGFGMLTSAVFKHSSTSLLAALIVWMVFSLLMPAMAIDVSRSAVELRSPNELSIFADETNREARRKMGEFLTNEAPKAMHFMGHGYNSEFPYVYDGDAQTMRDARDHIMFYENLYQERALRIYNLWREHDARKSRQVSAADRMSWLSPFQHLRVALTSIADTGYGSYDRFLSTARRYREQMLAGFENRGFFDRNAFAFFSRLPEEEMTDEGFQERFKKFQDRAAGGENIMEILDAKNWGALPDDIIPSIDIRERQPDYAASLTPIAIIVLMGIALVALGFLRFFKYDVR